MKYNQPSQSQICRPRAEDVTTERSNFRSRGGESTFAKLERPKNFARGVTRHNIRFLELSSLQLNCKRRQHHSHSTVPVERKTWSGFIRSLRADIKCFTVIGRTAIGTCVLSSIGQEIYHQEHFKLSVIFICTFILFA